MIMQQYFRIALAIMMSVLMQNVIADERPELGNMVYTYGSCHVSPARAHVLRYGPKSDNAFLVQILGIDHPLNGKMIVYKAKELQAEKLQYSLLNEQNGKVMSSLIFDGDDKHPRLYIRRYAGLYTPSGRLPENNTRRLCLKSDSLDRDQYYRRYEKQQTATMKLK